MNQNERQFGFNAGMDAAQLLNDYYQWAQNYNSGLYEWNKAQEEKAKSGGGGGGRSGGGGGYSGGYAGSTGSGVSEDPYTKAEEEAKKKNKKGSTKTKGLVAGKEGQKMYVNYHTKSTK